MCEHLCCNNINIHKYVNLPELLFDCESWELLFGSQVIDLNCLRWEISSSFDCESWLLNIGSDVLDLNCLKSSARNYWQISRTTSGDIPIAVAWTYYPVNLSSTLDINNWLIASTTNPFGLRNNTWQTKIFEVYASADIQVGNNRVLGIRLSINNTDIPQSECRAPTGTGNSNFAKLITKWLITLQPNDEVHLLVANHTDTTTLVLQRARMVATSV